MTVGKSNPPPPAPAARAAASPSASAPSPPTSRASVWIISAGVFVVNLDLFIVNVAVPALGDAFDGTSLASLSWVLNAYAIVFAALLVVAGRLADRYGHRRGFLLGLAVFTVASALCALAPGVGWLVAARALQAAGAAALMPTSLALLLVNTPAERRPGRSGAGRRSAASRPVSARWSAVCWWRRTGAGSSSSTCRSA